MEESQAEHKKGPAAPGRFSAHKSRFITGAALLAGVLLMLGWGPPWLWALLLALMAGLAMWEYQRLLMPQAPLIPLGAGWVLAAAMPVLALWGPGPLAGGLGLGLGLVLVVRLFIAGELEQRLAHILRQGFGLLYCGLSLASLMLLIGLEQGRALVLFTVLSVAAADIGAYYAGHLWGRHKLSPQLSPGKTWEGLFGGLILSAIIGALLGALGALSHGALTLALTAMLLAVLSVVGDLFESLIKRSVGAKDSGTLLPGHGGLLDRVDGLIMAAPALYLLEVIRWL